MTSRLSNPHFLPELTIKVKYILYKGNCNKLFCDFRRFRRIIIGWSNIVWKIRFGALKNLIDKISLIYLLKDFYGS